MSNNHVNIASISTKYPTIVSDINMGGILDLIKLNAKYNKKLVKSQFKVMPLDFTDTAWSPALLTEVKQASIIIAADGMYLLFITKP